MLKNSFYKELELLFEHFPTYHLKILLGHFNAKLGRENIFKPTIKNENLHQYSIGNSVIRVNCATQIKSSCKEHNVPHRNFHKNSWTFPEGKTYSQTETYGYTGVGFRIYSICYISEHLTMILITTWWVKKVGKVWQ